MTAATETLTDAYGDTLTITARDGGGAHFDPGRGNTNDVLHFDTTTLDAIRAHLNTILRATDPVASDPRNQPGHPAFHDRLTWLPPVPSTEYRHTDDGMIERVTPAPADWTPTPRENRHLWEGNWSNADGPTDGERLDNGPRPLDY